MITLEKALVSESPLRDFTASELIELLITQEEAKAYSKEIFKATLFIVNSQPQEEKIKEILTEPRLATEYVGAILETITPQKNERYRAESREALREIQGKALRHPNLAKETFESYIVSLIAYVKFIETDIRELFYRAIHTYPVSGDYLLSISDHPNPTIRSFIYKHSACPKAARVAGFLRGEYDAAYSPGAPHFW